MFKHIILIDDDDDDQFIFLAALKIVAPECECRIMNNGFDALRDLRAYRDKTDMIFLDLNMPIMNGFEFLAILKKDPLLSLIPVTIYSTSNNPLDIKRVKALGAVQFISKTSEIETLVTELGLLYNLQQV